MIQSPYPRRLGRLGVALLAAALSSAPAPVQAQSTSPPPTADAFARTFHSHTAQANGIKLHYVRGGSGPVVVLLHGWPTTWAEWRPIMPALARAGYTVIAPDLRGLGQSERPLTGYDSRTVAEDVHQLVRSLGLSQIHLVAHDIAGSPAYAYAAKYPQEVKSLAMLDAIPAGIQPAGTSRTEAGRADTGTSPSTRQHPISPRRS